METVEYIWMNGKLVKWDEAKVHVLTHALHYGLGVFEGIRCYDTPKGPAVFRCKEHMNRLMHSAHITRMETGYTAEDLRKALFETIKANNLKSCYIRPILFYGYGSMGLYPKGNKVEAVIACWPWGAYLGEEGMAKGIRCCISSFTRHHVNIAMTKAKVCGNYVNSQLAKIEALENGYDEALMLDVDGTVSEGTGENLFMVRNGRLKTPPLSGVLEGITRDCVITLAKEMGLETVEAKITRDELYIADEVFLCGTAAEITPVREVDHRAIGQGKPGPITLEVQNRFFKVVKGENSDHEEWLDFVK